MNNDFLPNIAYGTPTGAKLKIITYSNEIGRGHKKR